MLELRNKWCQVTLAPFFPFGERDQEIRDATLCLIDTSRAAERLAAELVARQRRSRISL
jgi:hypothetical protein